MKEDFIKIMGNTDALPDLIHLKGVDEKIMYKDDVFKFVGRCLDDAVRDKCILERVYVLAVLTKHGYSIADKIGRVCFKDWENFLEAVRNKTFKNWSEYKEAFQPDTSL